MSLNNVRGALPAEGTPPARLMRVSAIHSKQGQGALRVYLVPRPAVVCSAEAGERAWLRKVSKRLQKTAR